jgi:uncharacterized membrane protein YfcA
VEVLLGFVIALAIALTGVGAGSMTTPLLILLLHVAPATAVGTALSFGTVVKLISVPVYAVRRQVNLKVLGFLLAGGLPGVIGGAFVLDRVKNGPFQGVLYAVLGTLIVATAGFHFYRQIRPLPRPSNRDRSRLLPWIALPIGAEVGFSSAGAGALGSLVLLSLTRLTTAEVVGTDLCFGLAVSSVGSIIQVSAGNYDPALLTKLVIGGVLGAVTGSLLAGRIPQRPLRFGLLSMLILLGFQLALHAKAVPAHPVHAMLLRPPAKVRLISQP